MLEEVVNFPVVVVGVVMEQHECFHAGLEREGHGIIHAAVAPAEVFFVFRAVILRIENQHVGVAHELQQFRVVAAVADLGVGEKTDDAVGREEPVAHGHARMVGAMCAHQKIADAEIKIRELLHFDIAGQLGERHRKIRAFHLAGHGGGETFARAFAAEDVQPAAGFINRRKKGQPLDVIPMRVREEQRQIERAALEFRQQRLTEFAQAGAAVQNDDVATVPDFNAGGVAAVTNGVRAGRRNRTANAPKLDVRGRLDGSTVTQVRQKQN